MPIIPIIPSINTCMSLTTTTPTTTTSSVSSTPVVKMPELNTNELQALADVCSNIVPNTALPSPLPMSLPTAGTAVTVTTSIATPIPNVVMNSLVSPTKIITDDAALHPMLASVALPEKLPVACLPPPVSVIDEDGNSSTSGGPAMEQDLQLEDDRVAETLNDVEPMEECVLSGSPKRPSSLKSEDVVMAENASVSQ